MKFTIELTEQQVNIVLQSLAKLPLEQVIETFTEIKQQAEKQLQDDTDKQGVYPTRNGQLTAVGIEISNVSAFIYVDKNDELQIAFYNLGSFVNQLTLKKELENLGLNL